MYNIGYRTEELYGEGYRNAAEVMSHEVFELQNTDILDTLSNTILKNTEYEEKLKHLSAVIEGDVEDDELNSLCDEIFEDETIGIAYFEKILDEINSIIGKEIKYVLWLCDSIDDVKEEYQTISNEEFTSFDLYIKSDIILSDLGKGGKLYGYENNPTPWMNYDECDKLSHSSKNINDVIDELQEKVEYELKENIKRECNSRMFAKQFISD